MRKTIPVLLGMMLIFSACSSIKKANKLTIGEDAVARIVYFYAEDCTECQILDDELLQPLIDRCGANLEMKTIAVDAPSGQEIFVDAETIYIGESGRWDAPVILVEETYFIGAKAIRTGLIPHLQCIYADGGNDWPDIPSLQSMEDQGNTAESENQYAGTDQGLDVCISEDDVAACASPNPIFVLYLATDNCETGCDPALSNLKYLQGVYPQLVYEEKDIEENRALANAIIEEFGVDLPENQLAPAVVIGTDYLTGDALELSNLKSIIDQYSETGSLAVWYTLDIE